MKKLLSVILSVILALLFSFQTLGFNVDREEFYPIIIVGGYSASSMYVENPDGTKTHAWGLDMNLIMKRVLARSIDLAMGIGELTRGSAEKIGNTVGVEFIKMFESLRYNPDGTSVYNVKTYCTNAADSNNTYLLEHEDGKYMFEPEIMPMFGSYIGEDWNDYIFNFNTDFRQNVTDCAADLDRFVDSVLEYSGAKKVNIYAVSHGGQITATFLNLYGKSKADKLNNVILTVPAIGGAGLAYDFLSGDIDFGEENLMYFIENGMMLEEDYHWLLSGNRLSFLDDILESLIPYCKQIMGYWGSMWDFVPTDEYETLKGSLLDSTASAKLIEKTDYFHYEVSPSMHEKLQECIDSGINVYILAGSGSNDIAGYNMYGDSIITAQSSTGAACADYGKRFNDGYQTFGTTCNNAEHHHLSPDMKLDLSTGYLPEQTWVVDGLYHGMTIKSDYCTELITALMYTDELVDVYTFEEFPQFHYDTNRCQTVTAYFNSSVEGFVDGNDTALVVENCSKKYPVRIVSVACDGMDIDFDSAFMKEIPVGGKLEIPFNGEIPDLSNYLSTITVSYIAVGSVTPVGERTLGFTVMNGKTADFDEANPQVSVDKENDFVLNTLLRFIPAIELQRLFEMMYNAVVALVKNIF